jgi:hypothetical protein
MPERSRNLTPERSQPPAPAFSARTALNEGIFDKIHPTAADGRLNVVAMNWPVHSVSFLIGISLIQANSEMLDCTFVTDLAQDCVFPFLGYDLAPQTSILVHQRKP